MTKPGNSDQDGDKQEDAAAAAPEEPTAAPEESTKDSVAAEPATGEPAAAAAESAAAAEPAADDVKDADDAKDPASSKDASGAEDSAVEGHNLMAELEKAPPPPDEPAPVKPRKREKPVMPTAAEAARSRPDLPMPQLVRYSFYIFVAAAVVWVANSIFLLANKQVLIDEAIKNIKDPKITDQQIADSTNFLLWAMLILALVFGVFFALFGYKAQDGLRRSRIMLTVLSVLAVLFHFMLFVTLFGQLAAFLALIATILLYTPKCSAYFRAHQGT